MGRRLFGGDLVERPHLAPDRHARDAQAPGDLHRADAGVLQGAPNPKAGRRLLDFMLTERFQADVPLQMFVFPARSGTLLPPVFTKFAVIPQDPFTLPPDEIGAQRDDWIDQWTSTVLR